MQKITTFLMFNDQADAAVNLYTSVFKNSKIVSMHRAGPSPTDAVMSATFQLEVQQFMAFNGGPRFKFTWAISMFVTCKDQKEVDRVWKKLVAGGKSLQCGWLEDRYGLAWQIIPSGMLDMIGHRDRVKAGRAVQAMLRMVKIDIGQIRRAFAGKQALGRVG